LGILTSANGRKVKLMVMVSINGKTGIDTKVNGSFVLSMAKELICLLMEMLTLVNTTMVSRKVSVNTSGKTLLFMLGNL